MPRIDRCRSCQGFPLETVLDLGFQPVANDLIDPGGSAEEPRHPLEVGVCPDCGMAQVTWSVPPEELFGRDYPYFSSFLPALLVHAREHALSLSRSRGLGPESFVVEVASNDGYLLRNFVEFGVPCLGVDPAVGPAEAARQGGVPTLQAFFGPETAREIRERHGRADVIIANNVLAHVDGIDDFVAGFAELLKEDGVAVFEFPYLRDLVERRAFDTIYHEHVFYHALVPLRPLFARHGLLLADVERLPIHGGSLRLTVARQGRMTERAAALLGEELSQGIGGLAYWRGFAREVAELREELRALCRGLKRDGKRIAAYGAAAKGATLLNYVGLGAETIDYVVDRNPHKVGKLMPGVRLPVRPVEALRDDPPDVLLLLAWNFGREIMAQQRAFAEGGGRFLIPVPRPRLLDFERSEADAGSVAAIG